MTAPLVERQVYVLWWKYSDGSAAGLARAYIDEKRAQDDMKLLEDSYSSKDYRLEAIPLFGAAALEGEGGE